MHRTPAVSHAARDPGVCYSLRMANLRARVLNGRLVMDEPTDLPEGTVLELVADDGGDDLTDVERAALHEAIERAMVAARAGRVRPAAEVLADLRADV